MSVKDLGQDVPACGPTSCLDVDSVCEVVIYGNVIVRGASSYYKIFQHTIYGEHISRNQIQIKEILFCFIKGRLLSNHSNILSRCDLDLFYGLLTPCKLIGEKSLQ